IGGLFLALERAFFSKVFVNPAALHEVTHSLDFTGRSFLSVGAASRGGGKAVRDAFTSDGGAGGGRGDLLSQEHQAPSGSAAAESAGTFISDHRRLIMLITDKANELSHGLFASASSGNNQEDLGLYGILREQEEARAREFVALDDKAKRMAQDVDDPNMKLNEKDANRFTQIQTPTQATRLLSALFLRSRTMLRLREWLQTHNYVVCVAEHVSRLTVSSVSAKGADLPWINGGTPGGLKAWTALVERSDAAKNIFEVASYLKKLLQVPCTYDEGDLGSSSHLPHHWNPRLPLPQQPGAASAAS
ncbi:unnamed protein product, partial [Amoebophrya sp. A25]